MISGWGLFFVLAIAFVVLYAGQTYILSRLTKIKFWDVFWLK